MLKRYLTEIKIPIGSIGASLILAMDWVAGRKRRWCRYPVPRTEKTNEDLEIVGSRGDRALRDWIAEDTGSGKVCRTVANDSPRGLALPSAEELAAMQRGQYVLRAAGGELREVQVQKSRLPHDPQGHVQWLNTALAPDGTTVYVNQGSLMCKSTDGGRTWTFYERDWPGAARVLSRFSAMGGLSLHVHTRRASAVTARACSWRTT